MFSPNTDYRDVYMIFIDASGHSNVVKNNPIDLASRAFDLFYDKISSRLDRVSTNERCAISTVWSWLGDGGMIAIHDESETISVKTALKFAQGVLKIDLPTLANEFKEEKISGELHIRMSIHKGAIKYTGEGQQGFIHSVDINWGAHLEKATPRDSVGISEDVYRVSPPEFQKNFVSVGDFEDRRTYIWTPNVDAKGVLLGWRAMHGFIQSETIQCYRERISQQDKASLIDSAHDLVIDFGTTLNTCSHYLDSTERPLFYREAVERLLKRGGRFICYMLSPDSPGARQLAELRMEDTDQKLQLAMTRFHAYKKSNPALTENFKVYQFNENPNLAAMIIDPEAENSVCLYSPYLNVLPETRLGLNRADMPHYLVNKAQHTIYQYIWNYVSSYIGKSKEFL